MIHHQPISRTIPIEYVLEAIDKIEYATECSVQFKIMFLTGCRMVEMDSMRRSDLFIQDDGSAIFYWRKGKNQTGERKEILPAFYVQELKKYWTHTGLPMQDKMFHCKAQTFGRYFDRDIRPTLSEAWNRKVISRTRHKKFPSHYWLQLRALRRNGATLEFFRRYQEYNDAFIALEFACKRYGHSSNKITLRHYIEDIQDKEMQKFYKYTPAQILSQGRQQQLHEFV